MLPNPVLRRLGFADTDRVAIIHTDDIGMCQASVSAFADLWEFGLISSGAVMVPCPWFLNAAEFARAHPQADLGVHTTLTSEWQSYRWGPISTRDPQSGMVDEEGYFYHETHSAQEHGDPECVTHEIEAQVRRALAAGMQPTHFILHPSKDTPELREICPDWSARVANYETFFSEDLREYIRSIGIQVIGYRQIQDLMPAPEAFAGLML